MGGRNHFTSPSDVVVAENGDVFVADGHGDGNNRVVKFNRRGEFLMSWGQTGYGPGEFRSLHAIDIDPSGRGLRGEIGATAASRSSTSRGITSPPGPNSGAPAESPSTITGRSTWRTPNPTTCRIRATKWGFGSGRSRRGWVTEFIRFPWADPRDTSGNGAEFVAVDRDGNMYGGEPRAAAAPKVHAGASLGSHVTLLAV